MRRRGIAALVFFVLSMAGCTHAPIRHATGLKPEAFWHDQDAREAAMRRVAGRVTLRLEGRDHGLSGKGRLVSQLPPQRFRLELRDPLGRVQYLLTVEGDRLVAFYPRQHLAYTESRGGRDYVRRFMGLDFSFAELRDLFLGILPANFRHARFQSWEWDGTRGEYRGVLHQGGRTLTVGVDPDHAVLTEATLESQTDRVNVTYSELEPGPNAEGPGAWRLAHLVRVALEKPPSTVELEWQEIETLARPKEDSIFHIELPAETRRVDLD